jgi:hypothetical protein
MFLIDLAAILLRHLESRQYCAVCRVDKFLYFFFASPFHGVNSNQRHAFLFPFFPPTSNASLQVPRAQLQKTAHSAFLKAVHLLLRILPSFLL